jgi:hypothetical protein
MIFGNFVSDSYDFPKLILEFDAPELQPDAKKYVEDLQNNLALLYNVASRLQQIALEGRSNRYNIRPESRISVGDFVLLRRSHDDKPGKLEPLWLGPYKVIEIIPLNKANVEGGEEEINRANDSPTYRIQNLFTPNLVHTVHHRRLIKFEVREDVTNEDLVGTAAKDTGELIVEKVLGHSGFNRRDIRFTIKWLGFDDISDEPWESVYKNGLLCGPVLEYIQKKAPELSHLLRGLPQDEELVANDDTRQDQ